MNLFETQSPLSGENFETLLQHKNIKIQRIVSSDKIEIKEYMQTHDEWVLLVKGFAKLEVEGEIHELKVGDYLFIPAQEKHKVLETKHGTIWLAVHIS